MTTPSTTTIDNYGYPLPPNTRKRLRNFAVGSSKRVLLIFTYLCMSSVGWFLRIRRSGRRLPAFGTDHVRLKRILVIRLDLIGDLVLSLTLVHALKRAYPEAEIDLLALPSSAPIVESDPQLHEIITYNPNVWRRPRALLKLHHWREALALRTRLRARNYDLAISVFGPWASLLAALSGASRTLGFAGEGYPGFLTDTVPGSHWASGDHLHEVDYCLRLAHAAGVQAVEEDRIPYLPISSKALAEVDNLLREAGVQPGSRLIACHISSNNGQSKRWPVPYWATLVDLLLQQPAMAVVFTGAPADQPLIQAVLRRTQQQPINLAGKTTLPQLAALLQRADLLITGDSGPMHIAAAVGTRVIALHGPTDPAQSGPISPVATVLRSEIWCSPCYNAKGPADCRFFTTQCMKNITPQQVVATIDKKAYA